MLKTQEFKQKYIKNLKNYSRNRGTHTTNLELLFVVNLQE